MPMLWVYGHYKYVYPYSAGIDFRRQNLTSKVDSRAVMVPPWCIKHAFQLVICYEIKWVTKNIYHYNLLSQIIIVYLPFSARGPILDVKIWRLLTSDSDV